MNFVQPLQILVADDDPVSLQYLAAVVRELGAEAHVASTGTAVVAICQRRTFDLLLLDRRMPGLGGAALLMELRRLGCDSAAIATSAELDAQLRGELQHAGYRDALTKPIGVDELAGVFAVHLPTWYATRRRKEFTEPTAVPTQALLDDDAALATVGGDAEALRALRGLLARELEANVPRVASINSPMPTHELREYLHRLRASCRYCGASGLGAASAELEAKIVAGDMGTQMELQRFLDVCEATISRLNFSLASNPG